MKSDSQVIILPHLRTHLHSRTSNYRKIHLTLLVRGLSHRRQNSAALDVQSCGSACDTGHCLVGVTVRERLSLGKRD